MLTLASALVLASANILLSSIAVRPSTSAPPVVTIHAHDFSFSLPKSVNAGATTFRLVNDGAQLHHLALIKLGNGKTLADLMNAMKGGPPPSWITEVGGPNAALAHDSSEVTITLEPGSYAAICFIPSPGETAPHLTKGMFGEFRVLSKESGATKTPTDVTVHLSDYKFTFSRPLTAGRHTVQIVNDVTQPHEAVLVRLAPGKTIADFGDWVDKSLMVGASPGKELGGVTPLAHGRSASFPVSLKPGNYGLICFLPDSNDGKTHYMHGMSQGFTVAAK